MSLLSFAAVMTGHPHSPPVATQQLILVTTESWGSTLGNLQRYQRSGKKWRAMGKPIPVSVGKNGLAWGDKFHGNEKDARAKREGDGCAPAGIFGLGPAFGYALQPPAGCKLPYRPITERDYFVDAPTADDYNRWVTIPAHKPNRPEKLWPSFERMKRPDRIYEFGIVVQHNDHPIVKGCGSAIFLHVWRKPGVPTVGCTAMARDDLLVLLSWLDPNQEPLLVQAPMKELKSLLSIDITP